MKTKKWQAIGFAVLAAALYGISAPTSKALLKELPPTLMAALLYLGAGLGMLLINALQVMTKKVKSEATMTKKEMPFVVGMILLDIAAPLFLMIGLTKTTSANASLLNNFEIVATSLIALFIFKEAIGKRMWGAIALITLSSIILSFSDIGSFSFSLGSLFVLLACVSWGFENNCTRMLSLKDPLQVVVIKGFGSGIGSLVLFLSLELKQVPVSYVLATLILGFVAYGMSIYFYIKAQRELGAARTSAYYAVAPFIGVLISWVVLREPISIQFLVALAVMILGTYYAVTEAHEHSHRHLKETHTHKHSHDDGHHTHRHSYEVVGEHSHEHTHDEMVHDHAHMPDLHHRHEHA